MVLAMDTDARVAAQRYYSGSGRSLLADMTTLVQNPGGIVHYSSCLVALLRPVQSRMPSRWEQLSERPLSPNGWYVHLLVGDLRLARQIARHLPPLQWLCFRRGLRSPRPHIVPWSRILL